MGGVFIKEGSSIPEDNFLSNKNEDNFLSNKNINQMVKSWNTLINNNNLGSIDSIDINVQLTPLWESRHTNIWLRKITFTLTEGALLIFCNLAKVEKLLVWVGGLNPQPFDLSFQSGIHDISAMPAPWKYCNNLCK